MFDVVYRPLLIIAIKGQIEHKNNKKKNKR